MKNPQSRERPATPTSSKTRRTIGFLTAHFSDFRFYGTWTGIADVAHENDIDLICFPVQNISSASDMQGNMAATLGNLINPALLDGLITHQWWSSQEWFETCCRPYHPLPIITIFRQYPGYPGVLADNYQGMRAAIEHLIEEHGYRRIAYIRGPEGTSADDRYRAYVDALDHHRIPVNATLVIPGDHSFSFGKTALRLLLDDRKLCPGRDFEVIVSSNDSMLFGMSEDLRCRGIRIPDDVAVVGFDDETWAAFTTPPLTSTAVSWYDLGRRAAEALLALIHGQTVSDSIVVPTTLKIRRSCGCMNQEIRQAAVGHNRSGAVSFAQACAQQRATILATLQRLGGAFLNSLPNWEADLLDAFVTDVTAQREVESEVGIFLPALEHLLDQIERQGADVALGTTLISELRRQMSPCLASQPALLARAENIWQQCRVLIGEIIGQALMRSQANADQQTVMIRELGQRLISTFDVMTLMDMLVTGLPTLGFPAAYLTLYEQSQQGEWSRLIMAYNEHGRIELPEDGVCFPSAALLPDGLLCQERARNMVIEPLYFGEEQLGTILFEMGSRAGDLYAVLRSEISSALQGALLVRRVREHAAEIERQKYVLDTFMANVPDSIYFKDCESRIVRSNQAHARAFGLSDPAELVGKSDFDFFSEAQASPKYEQEQAIIRTGEPVLNLEEPDADGRWALTTKMPLRDEHGEIIGTFGISRDITDLKEAQRDLAVAYEEIHAMNAQLKTENVRMSAELDVSRRIQQMILPPPEELQAIDGIDIVGYMQPADEVGGDYYDVLKHHGIIHIGIGDVTGHGLESGVLMLMLQTAIRTLIERGETDPVMFLNALNRTVYKNTQRMQVDKTLTLSLISYQDQQLKIIGQHEQVLVVRKDGRIERVDTIDLGFPLGLEEDIARFVDETTVTLQTGDGVVLYTDGITEAENTRMELYGLDRLCHIVSQTWNASVEQIRHAVIHDVMAHIGTQKVYDDLTLLILKQR